jgi:DNA-binding transcriptional MerR regulator
MHVDEGWAMFTHAKLAEMADVKPNRLSYWERSGLVHAHEGEGRGSRKVRLYDYQDALTVLILAELREVVSLQHIRQIVAHLRDRRFDVPEVKFATAGKRVFFQLPDGAWEDVRDPSQIVLHQTLDLRPLRARLAAAGARRSEDVGRVERRRGARGSQPLVAGTRVPVAAVQRFIAAGASQERILEAYPALMEEDVEVIRSLPVTA